MVVIWGWTLWLITFVPALLISAFLGQFLLILPWLICGLWLYARTEQEMADEECERRYS